MDRLLETGFDAELVSAVLQEMVELVCWDPAGLMRDWFKACWTLVEDFAAVLCHGTGCGVGNPDADVFFCLSFSRLLGWCRCGLKSWG